MKAVIVSPAEIKEITDYLISLAKIYESLGHHEDSQAVLIWVGKLFSRSHGWDKLKK